MDEKEPIYEHVAEWGQCSPGFGAWPNRCCRETASGGDDGCRNTRNDEVVGGGRAECQAKASKKKGALGTRRTLQRESLCALPQSVRRFGSKAARERTAEESPTAPEERPTRARTTREGAARRGSNAGVQVGFVAKVTISSLPRIR